MKLKIYNIFFLATVMAFFAGCKKDNYAEPASLLKGRIIYQGQPLGVRSNGVELELWQRGYQLFTKIPVYVAQDGSFSATLFDGDYKLVRLNGSYPWAANADSINVQVRGSATVDVPMDPFFIIKNETYQKNGTTSVTATFNLQKVNTTRNLERVRLYIGQTLIVDQNNNAANSEKLAAAITDLTQPVTVTTNIPAALSNKDYIFVRIGVKVAGINEYLYTHPQTIQLK